jgi:uncharacterized protein GlcG (DUF336 family)
MDNVKLDLDAIQALLAHVAGLARERFNKPACVAVCDAYGFLLGFVRADGAPVRSIAISQQKAYTATRMGCDTPAFLARLRRDDVPIGYFCDPLLTALPGGVLLTDGNGRMLGAIGLSGLLPSEDQELAEAGAAFLLGGAN